MASPASSRRPTDGRPLTVDEVISALLEQQAHGRGSYRVSVELLGSARSAQKIGCTPLIGLVTGMPDGSGKVVALYGLDYGS